MPHSEAPLNLWEELDDPSEEISFSAFEAIVVHYQYLVEGIARKLEHRLPSYLEDDELLSLGQIGLLKAISKYEPAQGPFSRYASAVVYGAIIDGLRASDFAPRGLRKQQRDLEQIEQSLRDDGITSPTAEEIAERAEIDVTEVRTIQQRVVRAEVAPADPSMLPSIRTGSAGENLWSQELCREFVVWLKKFDTTTQKVVALKYWKGMSMKSISDALNMPVEQVRARHQRVLSDILPFMQDMARDD